MLSSLMLSNVALFKKQNIDFESGFNCLLGQSGAGKSIVIDALSFSLGAKADKNLIRSGENLMRVDAVFSQPSVEVKNLLQELDIDVEDEVIITRTLTVDGKSSIKINGYPVTAKSLKDVSQLLIDFCGQHDSVGLLNASNHILLLDKFIGADAEVLKSKVAQKYDEVSAIAKQIEALGGNEFERERTRELLEYQISEIENAQLSVDEEEKLRERFDFISSAEKIFEVVSDVVTKLSSQRDCVVSLLAQAKGELSRLSNFKEIDSCKERIENAYYELQDVGEVLEQIRQNTEFDQKEFDRIDARLDLIKSLSKKYGKDVAAILEYLEGCKQKFEALQDSEFLLEKLSKEREKAEKELEALCEELSALRKKSAKLLEKELTSQLADLEMKGTHFEVNFEKSACLKNGYDAVKFIFSANQGQQAKDLHKTASGGELSRLLLAFKNVLLGKEKLQTVVFDEIDSGISGVTAGKLAEKLENISKFTQVICITHTPVVAGKADNFLLVQKSVVDGNTVSTVKPLEGDDCVSEVARLIDGNEQISQTAIEHAKKLMK